MNELIRLENGEVKLDSRMIAKHFEKEHRHVLRDIRTEVEAIEKAGLATESIFGLSDYEDTTGRRLPCYTMTEEGAMQLAARYDAVARRKLILMIKEMKQVAAPKTQAEMLALMAQQAVEQERKLTAIEGAVNTIKETIIHEPDKWREEINRMLNRVSKKLGPDHFRLIRTDSYKALEGRARVDLARREMNLKARLLSQGAKTTELNKVCKLDVIEADPKLREIYTGIVKSLVIKHCA